MALVKFDHSGKGYLSVLRGRGVQRELQRRADLVRRAAQQRTDRELFADTYVGKSRAGATIGGVSLDEEADRRILGSSIDAARR